MPGSTTEAERIRDLVSSLTGMQFEILDIRDYLPNTSLQPVWFMACTEIMEANKIPYVNTLWKEDEKIRIESLTLGNTSQWIEQDYGEEAIFPVFDMDLSDFGNAGFRDQFLKAFPSVKRRIELQEDVVRDVSEKDRVDLEVRYSGGKGLAAFYLDAVVDASNGNLASELEAIGKSLKSMKEAYSRVVA